MSQLVKIEFGLKRCHKAGKFSISIFSPGIHMSNMIQLIKKYVAENWTRLCLCNNQKEPGFCMFFEQLKCLQDDQNAAVTDMLNAHLAGGVANYI